MRSRRRPSPTSTYLIAIAVFLVAFATLAISVAVLSPDDGPAMQHDRREGPVQLVGVAVRTLFLTDGSDASPKVTALLLPLAWVSLIAIVVSLTTCIRINLEFRRGHR